MWGQYDREDLVYFPQRFESDHGGHTKPEILASDPSVAWQALLTEGGLAEVPHEGHGQTIGGRRQIECGSSARHYLTTFPAGEVGWTPETYATAFWTTLERTGRPLDHYTITLLLASYLPASGCLSVAYWGPGGHRACLGWGYPGIDVPYVGGRAAVRVII